MKWYGVALFVSTGAVRYVDTHSSMRRCAVFPYEFKEEAEKVAEQLEGKELGNTLVESAMVVCYETVGY
jgi:hypothetical protein